MTSTDDFDYYLKAVVPSQTENISLPKKENFKDLLSDLEEIPKSKLKKKTPQVKFKNGYQQGVEIDTGDMDYAKKIASQLLEKKK